MLYFCNVNKAKQLNNKKMTELQITKRLLKGGISIENLKIKKDSIEVCVGYGEIPGFEYSNIKKTKALSNKIIKTIFPKEVRHSKLLQYGAIIIYLEYTSNYYASRNID